MMTSEALMKISIFRFSVLSQVVPLALRALAEV